MVDDVELARQWALGDRAAGQEVVQRHFDLVYRFFASKVDRDVDDLVQRTFLGVAEGIERIAAAASFRAYLLGIARNQLLRAFRTERRKPTPAGLRESGMVAATPRPSEVIAKTDEQRILLRGLRTLPLDLQTIVGLHYWDGLTVVEIGEVMGCPSGTIKHKLWLSRGRLRDAIVALDEPSNMVRSTIGELQSWLDSLPRPDAREEESS
ncbi:MAG: RNA polymerase sigma factor [Myxococcota bacterium]